MYFPLARIVHIYAYHMCCPFNPMLCTTLFSIKARAQFKSASVIFNSTILQQHQVNSSTTSRCAIPSEITNIYYTLPLTHHIHILAFGTGGFWYLGEGHLLGTLHPTRPGPNLFYVGEEEEPGWCQYSTDPRRGGGPRSLTMNSLER